MNEGSTFKQTSIRLPLDFIERAERLVDILQGESSLAAFGVIRRADVLRLALQRGLASLEREFAAQAEDSS